MQQIICDKCKQPFDANVETHLVLGVENVHGYSKYPQILHVDEKCMNEILELLR